MFFSEMIVSVVLVITVIKFFQDAFEHGFHSGYSGDAFGGSFLQEL
jgi:hypothetical protein